MNLISRRLPCLIAIFALCASALAAGAENGRRKVIFDQDAFGPAGSNLQAILLLLQAPDVELLGITVTSGDGWRDENVAHTLRLLEIANREEIPVVPGAVLPLVNSKLRTERWEGLYGKLYYKGAWTEKWPANVVKRTPYHAPEVVPPLLEGEPKLQPSSESAANFLIRKVREFPHQVTILAAGPLTNVALAARLDPSFASLSAGLVFMGGSFNPTPANNEFANEYIHNPRLEFNMRWDAEAASLTLKEPWPAITQIPVDPTTKTFFTRELIDRVAAGKAPFASYIGKFAQSFPMWDELAVAVWLEPTLVTRRASVLVDVDTAFDANYGTTLSWPMGGGPGLGERKVDVIEEVDVPRFEEFVVNLLTQ